MAIDSSAASPQFSGTGDANYRIPLVILTTLFFMWGFITCLNDILIPYLKGAFDLTYTQAMLIQFCFFGAYFIVSIPAGKLVANWGYQKGIVTGLSIAGVGCAMFYPAAALQTYPLFLGALFVLAAGITILQVSANPYVTVLGPERTASSRLTMTQAFNSLGTTVAPFFGAWLIFSGHNPAPGEGDASSVQIPYLMLAAALFALAIIFSRLTLPVIASAEKTDESVQSESLFKHRHLVLGAVGIFVYVGAEVAIGSFLVNFIMDPSIAGFDEATAAKYIAYYWGGAMVGRFIGAIVMQHIEAGKVLAFNAMAAVMLIILTVANTGSMAMWMILAVGLCNSIMFPTIFSLAIQRLGELTSRGSGLLCLAIVGGAIVPVVQGALADNVGVQMAFLFPALCYLYIAYYGLLGSKPTSTESETGATNA